MQQGRGRTSQKPFPDGWTPLPGPQVCTFLHPVATWVAAFCDLFGYLCPLLWRTSSTPWRHWANPSPPVRWSKRERGRCWPDPRPAAVGTLTLLAGAGYLAVRFRLPQRLLGLCGGVCGGRGGGRARAARQWPPRSVAWAHAAEQRGGVQTRGLFFFDFGKLGVFVLAFVRAFLTLF